LQYRTHKTTGSQEHARLISFFKSVEMELYRLNFIANNVEIKVAVRLHVRPVDVTVSNFCLEYGW